MSIPYLKIAGLVAVAAIVGAAAEASRSPSTSIEPAGPALVSGDAVTTLCIVSLDGAKFSVNCTSADVAAFMRSAPR